LAATRLGSFTAAKSAQAPPPLKKERWVEPQADLDVSEKRKKFLPLSEIEQKFVSLFCSLVSTATETP